MKGDQKILEQFNVGLPDVDKKLPSPHQGQPRLGNFLTTNVSEHWKNSKEFLHPEAIFHDQFWRQISPGSHSSWSVSQSQIFPLGYGRKVTVNRTKTESWIHRNPDRIWCQAVRPLMKSSTRWQQTHWTSLKSQSLVTVNSTKNQNLKNCRRIRTPAERKPKFPHCNRSTTMESDVMDDMLHVLNLQLVEQIVWQIKNMCFLTSLPKNHLLLIKRLPTCQQVEATMSQVCWVYPF